MKKATVLLFTICYLLFVAAPAAYAATATLSFSSCAGTTGGTINVDVVLNTGGADTSGTDAHVLFDTTKLRATSVTKGALYYDYPTLRMDNSAGRVTISGVSSSTNSFKGSGTLATVQFQVLAAGTPALQFDFTPGGTTDSNVVDIATHADILAIAGSITCNLTGGQPPVVPPGPGPAPTPAPLPRTGAVEQTAGLLFGGAGSLSVALWLLRRKI